MEPQKAQKATRSSVYASVQATTESSALKFDTSPVTQYDNSSSLSKCSGNLQHGSCLLVATNSLCCCREAGKEGEEQNGGGCYCHGFASTMPLSNSGECGKGRPPFWVKTATPLAGENKRHGASVKAVMLH